MYVVSVVSRSQGGGWASGWVRWAASDWVGLDVYRL